MSIKFFGLGIHRFEVFPLLQDWLFCLCKHMLFYWSTMFLNCLPLLSHWLWRRLHLCHHLFLRFLNDRLGNGLRVCLCNDRLHFLLCRRFLMTFRPKEEGDEEGGGDGKAGGKAPSEE